MGSSSDIDVFTLKNGIRVVHLDRKGSSISHCGLMIDAGSRDELKAEAGLAHFIEHSLFKGTSKRKTYHILNRLDSVGGEINAYTSKEETAVHCSFLNNHDERAIELIADITFNSTFPDKELEKEKEVIIDEIHSYMESPSEMIFDEFDEVLFGNHPMGRPILGSEKSVRKLNRDDVFNFIHRRYHPEKMVFAYYGAIKRKRLRSLCEKHLSEYTAKTRLGKRKAVNAQAPVNKAPARQSQQAHVMIGCQAYAANDEKKLPFLVLNNLLGGPAMNTLLNLNIRERFGIAYNLESHYQSYSDTGSFQVYMATEKKQMAKGIDLVHKELQRCRSKRLGTRQLSSAKAQIKGHIALSNDGGSNVMLGLAKSMLLYGHIQELDVLLQQIDEISASDILEVANEILSPDKLSTLIYS